MGAKIILVAVACATVHVINGIRRSLHEEIKNFRVMFPDCLSFFNGGPVCR